MDNDKCVEFQSILDEHFPEINSLESENEELRKHVNTCSECRGYQEFLLDYKNRIQHREFLSSNLKCPVFHSKTNLKDTWKKLSSVAACMVIFLFVWGMNYVEQKKNNIPTEKLFIQTTRKEIVLTEAKPVFPQNAGLKIPIQKLYENTEKISNELLVMMSNASDKLEKNVSQQIENLDFSFLSKTTENTLNPSFNGNCYLDSFPGTFQDNKNSFPEYIRFIPYEPSTTNNGYMVLNGKTLENFECNYRISLYLQETQKDRVFEVLKDYLPPITNSPFSIQIHQKEEKFDECVKQIGVLGVSVELQVWGDYPGHFILSVLPPK